MSSFLSSKCFSLESFLYLFYRYTILQNVRYFKFSFLAFSLFPSSYFFFLFLFWSLYFMIKYYSLDFSLIFFVLIRFCLYNLLLISITSLGYLFIFKSGLLKSPQFFVYYWVSSPWTFVTCTWLGCLSQGTLMFVSLGFSS